MDVGPVSKLRPTALGKPVWASATLWLPCSCRAGGRGFHLPACPRAPDAAREARNALSVENPVRTPSRGRAGPAPVLPPEGSVAFRGLSHGLARPAVAGRAGVCQVKPENRQPRAAADSDRKLLKRTLAPSDGSCGRAGGDSAWDSSLGQSRPSLATLHQLLEPCEVI